MVIILALISPFLLALSYEPFGFWFALPIGFAIFLPLIRRISHPILYSLYFGLISNLIILNWSGKYVGLLPWFLLSILQALFFMPVGVLGRFKVKVPVLIAVILIIEEIRARTPFGGFSWTRIAFSQIDSPLVGVIAFGGALALSGATLLLSYLIIERKRTTAILLIALFATSFFYTQSTEGEKSLNLIAVQGGVPEVGLDFNVRAMGVLNMHLRESYRSVKGTEDLVIWPENAVDIDPLKSKIVRAKINEFTRSQGIPLLAGAVLDDGPFNAAILFRADGVVGSIYIKRYLTPFGEYIPLRKISELLSPYAQRVNDFQSGTQEKIHKVAEESISSVICYEIINDGIVRSAALKSSIIVVHTNSATFAGTSEGAQQLAITRLRAIEHRRSIVSISTTGPSAIISARGEVLEFLDEGEIGALSADVTLHSARTLADYMGGFATILTLLLYVSWSMAGQIRARRGVR